MTEQYPLFPGAKRGGTSQDAAVSMAPRASTLREKALRAISGTPGLTADEVARFLGESVLAIRPRISELKVLGKVVETKHRRKNRSGKDAIVWRASEDY